MKRTDHLFLKDANPGKIEALRDLIRAFRSCAPHVAADQWQRFFETGSFKIFLSPTQEKNSPRLSRVRDSIGARRIQMLRGQIVGQLEGFISNRANDFRAAILGSTLDAHTRHQLLVVNALHRWFSRDPVVMRETGELIPDDVRRLARKIMHGVLAKHRRPRFHNLNPNIDERHVTFGPADMATHAPIWIKIISLIPKLTKKGLPRKDNAQKTISIPLEANSFFEGRGGTVAKTIQLIEEWGDGDQPGEIKIGAITDMEDVFAKSQAAYKPLREELALDLGLATMFATADGDLLGRDWRIQLERHDRRITGLARKLQKQGIRPNKSKRYRARVKAFRGFLKTEIGRVLNRLIQMKRPAHIVIENLDFTAPGLSRRLNRILARMGHGVIAGKLDDLQDRYGITWEQVNPAYSSQTCSNKNCGYVAKSNRKSQTDFVCGCCGSTLHADVNAARNLEAGRSSFDRTAFLTKLESLQATVHCHLERLKTRGQVASERAAIVSNPYYADALTKLTAATPLTAADNSLRPTALDQVPIGAPRNLAADVSAG